MENFAASRYVTDRLYRLADSLANDRRYLGIPGHDIWAYNLIDSVHRYFRRHPEMACATESEYADAACAKLRSKWEWRAWNEKRAHQRRHPKGLSSLEYEEEVNGDTNMPCASDAYFGYGVERRLVCALLEINWPEIKARAVAWRYVYDLEWEEVQRAIEIRYHTACTLAQLRQWGSRDLKKCAPALADALAGVPQFSRFVAVIGSLQVPPGKIPGRRRAAHNSCEGNHRVIRHVNVCENTAGTGGEIANTQWNTGYRGLHLSRP